MYGNAEPSTDAPSRESHVAQTMNEIERIAQAMESTVKELEQRLGVVLRSPAEQPLAKDKQIRQAKVPLAMALDLLGERFYVANIRLNDIVSRLEV